MTHAERIHRIRLRHDGDSSGMSHDDASWLLDHVANNQERLVRFEVALQRIVHDRDVHCNQPGETWWQTCSDVAEEALKP